MGIRIALFSRNMKLSMLSIHLGLIVFTSMTSANLVAQEVRGVESKKTPASKEMIKVYHKNSSEFQSLRSVATENEKFDPARDAKVREKLETIKLARLAWDLGDKVGDTDFRSKISDLRNKAEEDLLKMGDEILPYLVDSWLNEWGEYFRSETITQINEKGETVGADMKFVDQLVDDHISRMRNVRNVLVDFGPRALPILEKVKKRAEEINKSDDTMKMYTPLNYTSTLISEIKTADEKSKEPKKSGMLNIESPQTLAALPMTSGVSQPKFTEMKFLAHNKQTSVSFFGDLSANPSPKEVALP
jgi:hypothetical protein